MPVTTAPPPARNAAPQAPADLAEALRPVVLRLSRELRREAQRFGVSALDAQIMAILVKRPGIGVSELAEREQITKPAMSAHVKRLEEAGWIARDDGQDDRRRVGLVLTDAGKTALLDIRKQRNDWLAARIAALKPAQVDALRAALDALAELGGERA